MMLTTTVCRYEHFLTDWYARWAHRLGQPVTVDHPGYSYRKIWEWCAILQALEERGMLAPDRKGIGFAVGTEALPSILASFGVGVVATDLPLELSDGHWVESNQHAADLASLFHPAQCTEDEFRQRVTFRPVNMNDLSAVPEGTFDFAWSSCAIEHLGDLAAGMEFVRGVMRKLKPGGVGVHTTEFNLSSNSDTIDQGRDVMYRRRDIEQLDRSLRILRCGLARPDFDGGTHHHDLDYDSPPFFEGPGRHIKLEMGGYITTSFLLIAQKA